MLARNSSYQKAVATNDIQSLKDVPAGGNPHRVGTSVKFRLAGFIGGIILVTVLSIIGVAVFIIYRAKVVKDLKATDTKTVANQEVSTEDLSKVSNPLNLSDPSRTLVVNSASIFNGQIQVKKDLILDGRLITSGRLSVNGLDASAASTLAATNINGALTVTGVSNLQGGLNVAGTLSVSGNANISGDISANTVTARTTLYSGNLTINGHLVTTQSGTPSITANTAIVGAGGTATISGNDTSGTVTIKIGANPAFNTGGILAHISFRTAYTGTGPRVILTPNGSNAGELMYYMGHNLAGFDIGYTCRVYNGADPYDQDYPAASGGQTKARCTHLPQNTFSEYSFDYQVIQ